MKRSKPPAFDLQSQLSAKIVGQAEAISAIVPCVELHQARLAPPNRPIGVFLLVGPTGTGKTRTVEALAEVLHGSARNVLRVDCSEYQSEHEVSRLIGAPPGYVGHRETQPVLTQPKLAAVTTKDCAVSVVLFDEIEKAAGAMYRLLLGVFDRGILTLGDANTVNFAQSIIFLTSNLGARQMSKELGNRMGFAGPEPDVQRIGKLGLTAAKKKFSPEFMNRIDAVVTYQPLSETSLREILDQQIRELQEHISRSLASRRLKLVLSSATREWLLRRGTSQEYGAREIKRTLHQHVTQPLASMIVRNELPDGTDVHVIPRGERLLLRRNLEKAA